MTKHKHKWHGFSIINVHYSSPNRLIEYAVFVCEHCGKKKEVEINDN